MIREVISVRGMIFSFLSLCVFLSVPSGANADSWQDVGTPAFVTPSPSYPWFSMAFHTSTNDPWVAFNDEANGNALKVMRFDGTNWVSVGTTGRVARNVPSIAFHPSTHEPFVAFSDNGDFGRIAILRYSGSAWSQYGSTISYGNSAHISLKFQPTTNTPYVNFESYNSETIEMWYHNGSDWTQLGGDKVAGYTDGSRYTSFAFNPSNNYPYVLYFLGAKAVVTYWNGSAWNEIFYNEYYGVTQYGQGIAFHPTTNQPYIAALDDSNVNKVVRYDGSSWVQVGAAFGADSAVGSAIAFNPATNRPYVAFIDENFPIVDNLSVREFDGSTWNLVGYGGDAGFTNLLFHPTTGEPYITTGDTVRKFVATGGGGGGSQNGGGGGTNLDGSKYSYNYYPVTLDINSTISLACDGSVNMDAIVGTGKSTITLDGTKATDNMAMCNVKTNASGGYKMEWNSSATHEASGALKSTTNASDTISGYTMTASSETWSVSPTASEWGAKLGASSEGYGTGNGGGDYSYASAGGWGLDDGYANGKWMNVPTNAFQIMQKSTETDVDGEYQYLVFGAEIGADKLQPTGTYTQEVTVTATTL